MASSIGIGKSTMMTMTGMEAAPDLYKPNGKQYTSPTTTITPLLHTLTKIANESTKKLENRSYHVTGTPTYVHLYNALPTTSTIHHDQTETQTYGFQQHYSQNRCSERSSTTGTIVLDTMEQVIRLNGVTKAPPK